MLVNAVLLEAELSYNQEFMTNLWKPPLIVPKIFKLVNNSTKKLIRVPKSTSPKKNKSNVTSKQEKKKEQNSRSVVKNTQGKDSSCNRPFSPR